MASAFRPSDVPMPRQSLLSEQFAGPPVSGRASLSSGGPQVQPRFSQVAAAVPPASSQGPRLSLSPASPPVFGQPAQFGSHTPTGSHVAAGHHPPPPTTPTSCAAQGSGMVWDFSGAQPVMLSSQGSARLSYSGNTPQTYASGQPSYGSGNTPQNYTSGQPSYGGSQTPNSGGAPMFVRRLTSQHSASSFPVPGAAQGGECRRYSQSMGSAGAPPPQGQAPMTPKGTSTPMAPHPQTILAPLQLLEAAPSASLDGEASRTSRLRDDAMQVELDQLRRSVTLQDERIVQLMKDLQASRESEARMRQELDVSRAEANQIAEELSAERAAREQAESVIAQQQVAVDAATKAAQSAQAAAAQAESSQAQAQFQQRRQEKEPPQQQPQQEKTPTNRGASNGPSRISVTARGRRSKDASSSATSAAAGAPAAQPERLPLPTAPSHPTPPPKFTGTAMERRTSPNRGKPMDEIDTRLHEFLERTECLISFRRLNRGWYVFRGGEDDQDRHVEFSIVNGKLMAKVEPSTHDAGWNNGKLGPIERFVTAFST